MNQLERLMSEYISISSQVAYYLKAKNMAHYALYVTKQQEAAVKLIVALAKYHGITEDVFESEMRQSE